MYGSAPQGALGQPGLTGPYDISFHGREHTLNTFCVVLEDCLGLPEVL
ncbi:hypothetical protein [Luteimonas aestuarii]|nr:hypothetical protein [Luteimonas aestuarii]